MKSVYTRTKWIDDKTPVNAANLNNIENGIAEVYKSALGADELKEGVGVDITTDKNGNKIIGVSDLVQTSNTCSGVEFMTSTPPMPERNKIYFIINPDTNKLEKVMINGVTIFKL